MKPRMISLLVLALLYIPLTAQGQTAGDEPTVFVRGYSFSGNTLVADEELARALEEFTGRELTFMDLLVAASQVDLYYLRLGYPLVDAFLPAQEIVDGIVRVEIIEGRLGEVVLTNESALKDSVARAVVAPLAPGAFVRADTLDRALLLLSDVPGLVTEASLVAGSAHGTSDLVLHLRDGRRSRYTLSANTFGSEETGKVRFGVVADFLNLTGRGDELSVGASTDGSLTSALNLGYSVLVGRGSRAGVDLAASRQALGGEFAGAGFETSRFSLALSLTYPWLRSEFENRYVEASLERASSRDNLFGVDNDKERTNVAVTLRGDASGLLGDAWRYSLRATYGTTAASLTPAAEPYQKLNGDLAHVRMLAGGFQLLASLAAQWAFAELDTSERMVISGPDGVRGHPSGDSGDSGFLGRLELHKGFELPFDSGTWAASGFVDAGLLQQRSLPPGDVENVTRRYGYGLGLDWNIAPGVSIQIQRAWPWGPGADEHPRGQLWMKASVQF